MAQETEKTKVPMPPNVEKGGEKNEKKNDTKDEGGEENEKKNDVNSNLKSLAGPIKKVCGDAFKIASEMSNY